MKLTKILLEYPGAFTPRPEDERKRNQEDYTKRTDPRYKIEEYIENGSQGDLDLRNTSDLDASILSSIPDNFTVNGNLYASNCRKLKNLPKNLVVKGDLNISYTSVKRIPDDISIGRSLIVSNSKLEYIPDNFTVNGMLNISGCKNLRYLPKNLEVKGELVMISTRIKSLPDDIIIEKDLNLTNSQLEHLPDNFTVDGDLNVSLCINLTQLPKGLVVERDLIIRSTNIRSLPDDISVGKNIMADRSKLQYIPDNLTVNGELDLSSCLELKELPNNLKVHYLHIPATQVKEIPYNLMVRYTFYCHDTPLSYQNIKEEIEKMIKDKGGYVGGEIRRR